MISIFNFLKIGVGPSSSHTMGPMMASLKVIKELKEKNLLPKIKQVTLYLYGSLALTGKGHGSDLALCLGLEGYHPESVDTSRIMEFWERIRTEKTLKLDQQYTVDFDVKKDLRFEKTTFLDYHPNGMKFEMSGDDFHEEFVYFSTGGGFIEQQQSEKSEKSAQTYNAEVPNPFHHAKDILAICEKKNIGVAQLILENELVFNSLEVINKKIDRIIEVMMAAVEKGLQQHGILPGGLNVQRRAANIYSKLLTERASKERLNELDWISMYAISVNEENASFGRVVTAPTNGSAGIVPAVIKYLLEFEKASQQDIRDFLCVATAIGTLFKFNASISGAEVGCQGEVGVSCSMAAAGYTSIKNTSVKQVLNAAEIAIEHNLGLTCDPIAGLVQIPCIERNAIGAVKAIQSSRIAILNDGHSVISLDEAIQTMKKTGEDMNKSYKETSEGGLAANITFC